MVVVDNGSEDGTAELVAERFPHVRVVALDRNLGFGRAVNRGVEDAKTDAVVLINNDVLCRPDFLERILEPLGEDGVGMVAGVLLQYDRPELVDSAGIELDRTLRSWDSLWNRPADELGAAPEPVGPCGGAAAYRIGAFREVGGFDDAFFAYWEDVDLALRLRLAGHACRRAPNARALHRHGRPWARRRRSSDGSKRLAARSCSRATALRARAVSRRARRSRCSTGRCWSSTSSFAAQAGRCGAVAWNPHRARAAGAARAVRARERLDPRGSSAAVRPAAAARDRRAAVALLAELRRGLTPTTGTRGTRRSGRA